MAVIEGEEPIVSRVDRLDHMLRHLEEMRGCNYSSKNNNRATISPPRSSGASSTASSETLNSEGGQNSSLDDWSPRSLEKYCRPIDMVMMETQVKGNLIDRLVQVEDRVLKVRTKLITN
ncbi:hypothetical protein BVC80_1173g1 [Macleaya cordata]|uniref:Uncharacterized protein n=1 Tax=Macleaya cordata TaxID=56857 RepID=A0A200QIH9_MACCD|nr:hypothetical protein BVC80_1173g1 [Macleaya cordata]